MISEAGCSFVHFYFSTKEVDGNLLRAALIEARRGILTEEVLEHFFCASLSTKDDIEDKKIAFDIVMLELTEKGLLYPVPEPPSLFGSVNDMICYDMTCSWQVIDVRDIEKSPSLSKCWR